MKKDEYSVLIGEHLDKKVTVQMPWDADFTMWMDAFKAVMIGVTFSEDYFGKWLVDYCYDQGYIKEES